MFHHRLKLCITTAPGDSAEHHHELIIEGDASARARVISKAIEYSDEIEANVKPNYPHAFVSCFTVLRMEGEEFREEVVAIKATDDLDWHRQRNGVLMPMAGFWRTSK